MDNQRKTARQPGTIPSGQNINGFTTEPSLNGERRSIRHYNDGRVSQRETPIGGSSQAPTMSKDLSRRSSTRAVPNTMEQEYQPPSPAEIRKLRAAVDRSLQPEGSKRSRGTSSQAQAVSSPRPSCFDGLDTPPPVASPTPESFPELMKIEVFPSAVTASRDTVNKNANTISSQWYHMSGKECAAHSEIHEQMNV
ncbi:hypothetical protein N7475_001037 [Penicillium sp. IBT 31633x]|nr:hypothetical protein N7475_001037 [Penicillium sp. IBT 31633x]